jgi:proline dehydrogenase
MTNKTSLKNLNLDDTQGAFVHLNNNQLKKTYYIFALMNQKYIVKIGTFFIKIALKLKLPVKKIIKNTIFQQFCGGETIQECKKVIDTLSEFQVGTILDYSVEGEGDDLSYQKTKNSIIETVKIAAEKPEEIPFAVFKVSGLGSMEILEKVQFYEGKYTNLDLPSFQKLLKAVDEICSLASMLNVKVFVDAEESWIQDGIDAIALNMMEKYNTEKAIIFNTYQMYRTFMLDNLKRDIEFSKNMNFILGVKLVRGAYMEKERNRAIERNYPDPIQVSKENTDNDYNKAISLLIENINKVNFCLGTHNEYSSLLCAKLMIQNNIDNQDKRIYFAQLLGMSDNISFNLANSNFNVAKYVPFGPVESVMPYLIRRAEENTSISGQSSREFLLIKKELKRRSS